MSVGDIVAIASFAASIFALIFAIGKQANRLQVIERDVIENDKDSRESIRAFDKRIDKLSEFTVRMDQRVVYLEERSFGEDTAARMRDM